MKISVIIPTYNRPEFLEEALESVWAQTFSPYEIIIGDDSNNKETEVLVERKLKNKSRIPIKYFHHQPSLKQAGNVDFILQKASGDCVLLLHDDDALLPNCLEILMKPMIDFSDITASFGKQYLMNNSGEIIKGAEKKLNEKFYRTADREGIVKGEWAGTLQMLPNNSFLVRTVIAQKTGYLDGGRAGDAVDFYFGFRLGKNRQFYFVNEFTSKYRTTTNSITGSGSVNFISATLKILLEDLDKEQLETKEVKNLIRYIMNPSISEVIKGGDKRTAVKWMFSPYYNVVSLKGIKRIMMVLNPF